MPWYMNVDCKSVCYGFYMFLIWWWIYGGKLYNYKEK